MAKSMTTEKTFPLTAIPERATNVRITAIPKDATMTTTTIEGSDAITTTMKKESDAITTNLVTTETVVDPATAGNGRVAGRRGDAFITAKRDTNTKWRTRTATTRRCGRKRSTLSPQS